MENKKKSNFLIILIVIFTLATLVICLFVYKKDTNIMDSIKISDELTVQVYSKVKVSNFVELVGADVKLDDYEIDTTVLGNKKVNFEYSVSGKKHESSFSMKIVDTTKPYIGLGKSYTYIIGNDFDMENNVFCGDNYDKNPKCAIIGDYNLSEAGEYNLIYRAEDGSGNSSETFFTLKVLDKKVNGTSSSISFDNLKERIPSDGLMMIDVSKWQGDIDWETVSKSGVKYVMLRLGTQLGIGKSSVIDSFFKKNIIEAQKQGLKIGVYYYSYAKTVKEAEEQADWVINSLKGYTIDLPVAFDWECWSLFNSLDINFYELNMIADSFLKKIEKAGYYPLLYGSKNYLENVWSLNYDVWLAHYTENTSYVGERLMWQFTNAGKIPGISGLVDVGIYYNNI